MATRWGGVPGAEIQIAGIPAGASVVRAFLYWSVAWGDDAQVELAGQAVTGTLIGRSPTTCIGSIRSRVAEEDTRVYRADVGSIVAGNGTYPIAGVGDGDGDTVSDGHGASLAVVYEQPAASFATSIVIDDGSISGGFPGFNKFSMQQTFGGLGLTQAPLAATLHTAVGDGQSVADDGGLRFAGTQLVPDNGWNGSDGDWWDDVTVDVPTALLPQGTQSATTQIDIVDDCMVWVYAALEMRVPLPPVSITSPAAGSTNPSGVTVAGAANSPAASIRLTEGTTLRGTATVNGNAWSAPITLGEGTHTITATALDAQGVALTPPADVTFTVDATPPTVSITTPRTPAITFGELQVRGNTADERALGRVTVTAVNAATGQTATAEASCPTCWSNSSSFDGRLRLPAGVYAVTATAYDSVGNSRTSSPAAVVVQLLG